MVVPVRVHLLVGRLRLSGIGASVACIAGCAILLGLGQWQLERLAWKEELLAQLDKNQESPAIPINTAVLDQETWQYRQVRARVEFDGAGFFLSGISEDGAPGWHRMASGQVMDEQGRQAGRILVKLGWEPLKSPEESAEKVSESSVLHVRPGSGEVAGTVLWRDSPSMMRRWLTPEGTVTHRYALEEGVPVLWSGRIPRPTNPHLGYALTWYGLALALVLVWAAAAWRIRKQA